MSAAGSASIDAIAGALARQRDASDPSVSAWVAANAGAGKTHVLTERVARLLFAGSDPARILCLTYTKAAAAEMTSRLYELLGSWSTMPDRELQGALGRLEAREIAAAELPAARRLFARALETPGGLKIDTIHAFCANLLARFPLEADLAPQFEIMDDRTSAELGAETYRAVLAAADTDCDLTAAIGNLLEAGRGFDLSLAITLAAQRRSAMPVAVRSAKTRRELLRHINDALGLHADDTPLDLIAAALSPSAFPFDLIARTTNVLAGGSSSDQERAQHLALALVHLPTDARAAFETYLRFYLTDTREPRKKLTTNAISNRHPGLEEELKAEQNRILALLPRLDAAECASLSASLLHLAGAFEERIRLAENARALVTYDALIAATLQLLSRTGSEWVLYKLDGGVDHILVDEAQDTSPDQWVILNALAGEFFAGHGAWGSLSRTFFAVGDEKQSIYSFQGAEPHRFAAEREAIGARVQDAGAAWRALSLEVSFRSVPAILEVVDRTFAPPEAHAGLGKAAPHHIPKRTDAAGLIELWPVVADDPRPEADDWAKPFDYVGAASAAARLAARIASTVRNWIDTGERLAATGRPIAAEDILILVQHRDAYFVEQIRALKECGLEVAGADRLKLMEEIAVMDLIAAAQIALLPEDDLTLASVLKSPLIGLDEEALFTLAYKRPASLWSSLESHASGAPFAEAHARIKMWRTRADFMPPFEFFARLLGEEGGRWRLLQRLGPDVADPIEELLSLALHYERKSVPSLQGFLHWIASGPGEVKRDMEEASGRIRVMTVHGAKGLEANIIFLADGHRVPMTSKLGPLYRVDDDTPNEKARGLLLRRPYKEAAFPELNLAIAAAERRQREEYHRLLYVAMTRARDRLYVCGYNAKGAAPDHSWHAMIARGLDGLGSRIELGEGFEVVRYESGIPGTEKAEEAPPQAAARAMPEALRARAPREHDARAQSPSRLLGDEDALVLSPLAGDDTARFRRGQTIHRLVELLPPVPPEARRTVAAQFVARLRADLSPQDREEIIATTMALLGDPALASLFGPNAEAEVAIAGHVEEWGAAGFLNGRIDRLLVESDRVALVDLKTNRPAPASLGDVPEAYIAQLAGYRALLRETYPGRRIEAYLLWTDGPCLMSIPDERLDAVSARIAAGARTTI